jgi:alcohol dehydrogenase
MPASRDVWRIDRAGSLDRLTRRTESLPDPAPGEVRVAVRAIGLNFADIFACLGLYSATPKGSFIPGLEYAGVVDAVGPASTDDDPAFAARDAAPLRRGDHVVGLTRFGGYTTAINASRRELRPLRSGWTMAQGAAFPVQALTAWYGLIRLGALEPGEAVLVQAAAGGVGLNALAILKTTNARAVAVVGREEKRAWLVAQHGLATSQVIVRDRRTFAADLDRALTALGSDGFDLVFDSVAGPFFRPAFARLRPEGRHVVYGAADFMARGTRVNYPRLAWRYAMRPRVDPLRMMAENRSVMAFNLIWMFDHPGLPDALLAIEPLIAAPPHVGRTFAFADLPAAMRHLQSGVSIGKVVVTV